LKALLFEEGKNEFVPSLIDGRLICCPKSPPNSGTITPIVSIKQLR